MSEQHPSLFRTPEEELERLGRQLADIREALKEISSRVSLIERHVKRAFGLSRLPGDAASRASRPPKEAGGMPSFPPEQARPILEEPVQTWRESSPDAARARLDAMSAPDLKLLAHELGLSFPKKPSRKALVSALIGRINESILLSRNASRESPPAAIPAPPLPPHTTAPAEPPAPSSQPEQSPPAPDSSLQHASVSEENPNPESIPPSGLPDSQNPVT